MVWAAIDPPSPSTSGPSATGPSATGPSSTEPSTTEPSTTGLPSENGQGNGHGAGQGQSKVPPDMSQQAQLLHSESVVKKRDGTFETLLTQQGTVDAISDSAISVKSEDGFSQSYALNADTRMVKIPAPAAHGAPAKGDDGKRLRPADVTAAEIATGDTVRVIGVRNGSDVTARRLVDGPVSGPATTRASGWGTARPRTPRTNTENTQLV